MDKGEHIDIGKPGEWNPKGLKQLEEEIIRLAQHHAETKQGSMALRWYLLDIVTDEPVPDPFDDLEMMLQKGERSFWSVFDKQRRSRKGHLNDREVSFLLGHETDSPIKRRKWKTLREKVFSKIGLQFGPLPKLSDEKMTTYEIGSPPDWQFNEIRLLDEKLIQMCDHHAETQVGAKTLRWHIWDEITAQPKPVSLMDVQQQLENAEESLMGMLSDDVRRLKGHLGDESIARMLGFRSKRPIVEGYYCHLREKVFTKLAEGFGDVDVPWIYHTADDIDVGRQGEWKRENLTKLGESIETLAECYARTPAGAQALRWFLLDEITKDPEPISVVYLEQRLKKMGGSIGELFAALKRVKPILSDSKIARFTGLPDSEAVSEGAWKRFRKRVTERVDVFDDEVE